MERKEKEVPFIGSLVADFTQLAQGPWATQTFGDMGPILSKLNR